MSAHADPATAPGAVHTVPPTPRPEHGDELELRIDSLAHGGEGVARLGEGGYVVFVAGAVPGDRVRAEVYKRKRSYAHARAVEILEPSPQRIPPLADHPGVPWQVLPYERQLAVKQEQVEDALRRIGGLDGFELEPIVPALEEWRYRNKLEYSFGNGENGELQCGFHAPAGWNRVIPLEDCLLASERGNQARRIALRWCRERGLRAWERGVRDAGSGPRGEALLRNLVVREGRRTGRLQVRLVSTPGKLPDLAGLADALLAGLDGEGRVAGAPGEVAAGTPQERALGLDGGTLAGVLWTRSAALAETTAGGDTELVWGEPELPERIGELDLRISPEAFLQTNTEMSDVLYGIAADYAALEGWERVYDLYCGIGTIALTLAPRAGELWGIELIEQAVADAIAGARRNEIDRAHFFAGDTRLALPELVQRAGRPDVVVVDPPRAGLSAKVVRRIIEAAPRRIVYVSCNPTTLAPNAAQLEEAGWKLRRVRPVDMFPQTHHVETVSLLERG